jgi:hypothetical protein
LTLDENNKFTIAEEEDEFFDIPLHLQAVLPAPQNELLWHGRWKIEGWEVRLDYDKTNLVEWLKVRTYSAHGERCVAGLELMYDNKKGSEPHQHGFDRALIGAVVGAVIGNNVGPRSAPAISGLRNFPGAVAGAAIASGDPPSPPSEQIRVSNGAFYTPTMSQGSIVDMAISVATFNSSTKHTDSDLAKITILQFNTFANGGASDGKLTDAGLKKVAKLQPKLQQLTMLGLSHTKITDAGLKEVAKLQNLTELNLSSTEITDVGLKEVAKLQKLTMLDLVGTKITKAGVAELQRALPKCEIRSNHKK